MSRSTATTDRWTTTGSKPEPVVVTRQGLMLVRQLSPALVLSVALVIAVLANIAMGAVSVTPTQIVVIVGRHLGSLIEDLPGAAAAGDRLASVPLLAWLGNELSAHTGWLRAWFNVDVSRQQDSVVWAIRLPRTLMGLAIGAGLAVSGAAMQGMFRNPLADPALIGVSTGAALGAVSATVLNITIFGLWTLPVFAFIAGVIGTMVVYLLSRHEGRTEVITLILAGVALNAIAGAAVGLLMSIANDQQLRSVTFWTLGSLGGSQWSQVGIVAVVTSMGVTIVMRCRETLNLFVLGEREARHLGVNIEQVRIILILVTAAMTGVAVAFAGAIGFVGLIVPHLVRLWRGPDHRHLIPLSALAGGTLLLLADLASRTLAAPSEFPIGVTMSLVGGPFFIWLLLRTRRQQGGWG